MTFCRRKSRQWGREYQDWGFINNRVDFWISSWYCQLQQNLQSVNSKVQSNLFLPAGLLHRIDWFMDKGEMTGEKLKWLANSEPWIKLQFAAFRAKGRPHSFIIRRTPGSRNKNYTKQQTTKTFWLLLDLANIIMASWTAHKLLLYYQPQTAFHLNLFRWKQSFMNLKCNVVGGGIGFGCI